MPISKRSSFLKCYKLYPRSPALFVLPLAAITQAELKKNRKPASLRAFQLSLVSMGRKDAVRVWCAW